MRKLVYSTSLSLDGYIDSAAGDPGWVVPDEELHRHFTRHGQDRYARSHTATPVPKTFSTPP